ncbi:MAG: PAS domain-containing protein [Gemmatimonadaceae bacterium]|nr:PAS domain-containing protein [Gemmatimonadaceae bacterium]
MSGSAYLDEFLYSGQEFTEIDQWRERILSKVLLVMLGLGTLTAIPAFYFAITRGPSLVTLIDAVALALLAFLSFKRDIPFRVRAWVLVLLTYAVGTWYLLTVGAVSQIYLVAFPVLTALFLGVRPAAFSLVFTALTLAGVGVLSNANIHLRGVESEPMLKWVIIALNFSFIASVLTMSTAILLQKLERSLEMQKIAARSVDLRQAELTRTNAQLAHEIETRKKAEGDKLRLARAVGQIREIILMTDPDGKIVYANRAFEVLSGRSLKSMSVLWLQQLRTLSDSGYSIAEIVREQREWSGIVEFIAADGESRKMETVISPSRDQDGTIANFVAVMRESVRETEMQWS